MYDRIAGTLLAVVLVVAVTAWCLDFVVEGTMWSLGLTDVAGPRLHLPGVGLTSLRTLVFGIVEIAVLIGVWSPLLSVRDALMSARERTLEMLGPVGRMVAPFRTVTGGIYTAGVTVLLAFFLLQPHLVMPWRLMPGDWSRRVTQLIDGTASLAFVDAVWWGYRAAFSEPVAPGAVVPVDQFYADLSTPEIPLVDRWDDLLMAAADGDRDRFAKTKAFMWVESGGRQYAVSATGCAGLMQFCASTAQRRPFRNVFGVGAVAPCGCRDCSVPRTVQIELETDPLAVDRHAGTFPCSLSDARFDPDRSIRAGTTYLNELSASVGGHLPIMYVGYNSGPAVANRLYRAMGRPEHVTIDSMRPHLADALRPWYGRHADSRARGLLDVHLPKLQRAYERFR